MNACARWLELLAAYKAGKASNQGAVDRAKTDDTVARLSDDAVAQQLRDEWSKPE